MPRRTPRFATTMLVVSLLAFTPRPGVAVAIERNELTRPGTLGAVRVHPIMRLRTGEIVPLTGDPRVPASDPMRTIGDVPPPPPDGDGPECTDVPEPPDCLRSLGLNHPDLNASVSDGHTHYHAGDDTLLVNEIKGFAPGDTLLVGSPFCDVELLGITCTKYWGGMLHNEQPAGEMVVVAGGDAGKRIAGPGILRLTAGLRFDHPEGTRIVKLPALVAGQPMIVTIPNAELLGASPVPVNVRAELIAPAGSHVKDAPRHPLPVHPDHPKVLEAAVAGPEGTTTFFVPPELSGRPTFGPTFSNDSDDTWYTILVEARDAAGQRSASGAYRFKVTSPFFLAFARDSNATVRRNSGSVRMFGVLRQNVASAVERATDNVLVEVLVRRPDGTVKRIMTNTCFDHDPAPKDVCGGDTVGYQKVHHGEFMVRYGGQRGPLLWNQPPSPVPAPSPVNRLFGNGSCEGDTMRCTEGAYTNMETFQTGTYEVTARVYNSAPPIEARLTFVVQ